MVGLLGQINNEGILVSEPSDLDKIDISRPVYLFAQTTMGIKAYNNFADILRKKMEENGIPDTDNMLTVNRTICGQVSNREPHLKEFAAKHETIIFVSGQGELQWQNALFSLQEYQSRYPFCFISGRDRQIMV